MSNLSLVFRQDASEVLMTDSRRLAEGFGMRHADVLRKIEAILVETEESFHERNFALMFQATEIGNGASRQGKMYALIKSHFGIPSIGTFKDLELRDYDAVIQFIREVPLPRAWDAYKLKV